MTFDIGQYKQDGKLDYDKQIIELLKNVSCPLSASSISLMTGLKEDRILKKLKTLQKFSIVELVTSKKVCFWRLK